MTLEPRFRHPTAADSGKVWTYNHATGYSELTRSVFEVRVGDDLDDALTAAGAVAGIVTLIGDHTTPTTHAIPSGVELDGTQGSLTQTSNLTTTLTVTDATNVTIKNLHIVGVGSDYFSSSGVLAAAGIKLTGSTSDVRIVGCRFEGVAGACVLLDGGIERVSIRDCVMTGPGATEITAETDNYGGGVWVSSPDNNDVEIVNCRISEYAQGVFSGECSNLRISNNRIFDIVGQHGLYIEPSDHVVITGNIITDVALQGIKLQVGTTDWPDIVDVTIAGNVITNTGSHAVILTNPVGGAPRLRRIVVTGNTLTGNGNGDGDGLNVDNLIGGLITGNSINDHRHGISLGSSSGVAVQGNRIVNCARNGMRITNVEDAMVIANRISDVASENNATAEFGISVEGASSADLTIEGNVVTDSGGNMRYGFYVSAGDQASYAVRNNEFTGATDYGARLDSTQAIKSWTGNICQGGTGPILNFPSTFVNRSTPSTYTGTAAPTSGTWVRGDIVWNLTPAASGTVGWVCVTAGTPGTWKTFGAIAA